MAYTYGAAKPAPPKPKTRAAAAHPHITKALPERRADLRTARDFRPTTPGMVEARERFLAEADRTRVEKAASRERYAVERYIERLAAGGNGLALDYLRGRIA